MAGDTHLDLEGLTSSPLLWMIAPSPEAATSATAATFPLSCVAVVAGVAAFPEVEGTASKPPRSRSGESALRLVVNPHCSPTYYARARARGMGQTKVLLLTFRGICPCAVNKDFLRLQRLFIRLSPIGPWSYC